jgi:hypothetical protein
MNIWDFQQLHIIRKLLALFIFFISLIFIFGCSEAPVYSKLEKNIFSQINKNNLEIAFIENNLTTENNKNLALKILNLKENKNSNLQLEIYFYISKSCNNPERKSFASDYNGYIRLKFFYKNQKFYQVQTQFRGDDYKDSFIRALEFTKSELNF